jgi:hypothetical protein
MRGLKVALILLIVLAFSASASAALVSEPITWPLSFTPTFIDLDNMSSFGLANMSSGLQNPVQSDAMFPSENNGVLFDTIVSPVVGSNWQWPEPGNANWLGNSISITPSSGNTVTANPSDNGSVPASVVNAIVNTSNVEDEPLNHMQINTSSVKLISSTPDPIQNGIEKGAVINEYQFNTVDGKTHTCHVIIYQNPDDWPQVQDIDGTSYEM